MTDKETSAPKTVVGSIVNAVAILRHLGVSPGPQGVTAIASALRLNPSSCFNILRTLTAEGLVEFDPSLKVYALSLGTYDLARLALRQNQFFQLAQPRLQEISNHYAATGTMWRVISDARMAIIGVTDPEAPVRIHLQIAHRGPTLMGASGRCYAATNRMTKAEIAQKLKSIAFVRPIDLDTYMDEVNSARTNGWSSVAEDMTRGVVAVAAPVIDDNGTMRYSVSAALFNGQHSNETIEQIGRELRNLGEFLAHRLYGIPAGALRTTD